jgi:hypothetical protein
LVGRAEHGNIIAESALVEAAMRRTFKHFAWALALVLAALLLPATTRSEPIPVDVELVIAVDISYSMDYDELALQRGGYVAALTSKQFLDALKQGAYGRIAVTYVEWAGANEQRILVPWQLIDGPASADAFAGRLAETPIRRAYRTSISGALKFSAELFGTSDFKGLRRVIDVSGDGTNNQGPLIEPTRDEGRQGHHDQRLAGDAEDAARVDGRYSKSARVLRGLRGRRPRRVRGAGARPPAIRRRDPQQARARSVEPAMAATNRTESDAGGEPAARLLHHRRAHVAGALGPLAQRSNTPTSSR